MKPLWWSAIALIVGIGLWTWGCQVGRSGVLREAVKSKAASDSALAVLRADSASQAARRAFLQAAADSQHAATLDAEARLAEQIAATQKLRRVTREAVAGLDSARTASDSLLRYPKIVALMTKDWDKLVAVLDSAESVIERQTADYQALKALQVADSAGRLNAEHRANALASLNESLRVELAHSKTNLLPRIKWSVGTAAVGAVAICALTTVC